VSFESTRYRVHVRRGAPGQDEAEHEVLVVSWTPEGDGGPQGEDLVTFFRSACKPFQALPLVERGHADRFGFGARELAVMSASHNGAAEHVSVVRGMLDAIGLTERHLLCGFHYPEDPDHDAALRKGALTPSPIYNNCSGKHAGMLALAVAEGWPVEDYVSFDHPVQQAGLAAVAEVCGVDRHSMPLGVDGCSAANPAMPLSAMARGFSNFARARDTGGADARERALARIRGAMIAEPVLVAGVGRFCTDVLTAGAGTVVTKTGAEGLQCLGFPGTGEGVAVKVKDGSRRAVGPAVLAYLRDGHRLSPAALTQLERWAHPSIQNHRGLVVGELRAAREAARAGREAAEPATTARAR
jgi:L-asparaginase II